MASHNDKVFDGSIPDVYETHLVPLIFEPYAADVARRLRPLAPTRVLELAAGTGVVTRALASALPATTAIVATDLNPAMLAAAGAKSTTRPVEWREADALALPFDDGSFDAVVCQFGVMFFPDKVRAFAEARRVLRPGGTFLFNVWDRIEENEFPDVITQSLRTLFPADPPLFLARTPYGYHDVDAVRRHVIDGGFRGAVRLDTVTARSKAPSPEVPAIGFCQGSPLRNEILQRDPGALGRATDVATEALAERFGRGPVDGKIQAHVVAVDR